MFTIDTEHDSNGNPDPKFSFNAYAHGAGYALVGITALIAPIWIICQRAFKMKSYTLIK